MPGRAFPRLAVTLIIVVGVCLTLWSARSKTRTQTFGARDGVVEAPAGGAGTEGAAREPSARNSGSGPRTGPTAKEAEALAETQMMARLRNLAETDPEGAIALARDGNRRFPDSADAPERTSILIHALAQMGRSSEARGEAEAMVNEAPDSEWVREIERFTGAHRHRNVYVTDAGTIGFR